MDEPSTSSSSSCLYKLSRELIGHTDEVQGLAVFKNGNIVSTSKDKTTRFWKVQNGNYSNSIIMKGHSDVISSVCVIEPTEKNPTGFIITGGYDKKVCIYYPGDEEPIHTVQAHENNINYLKASVFELESFFTCSSDGTGKLWDLYDLKKPVTILSGHAPNSVVYCIADINNGFVITGGSDKKVVVYERNGKILHNLFGHSSCVKDIALINDFEFLTCSNDIRHWNAIHGICLGVYHNHKMHTNNISTAFKGSLSVSCGKDQTFEVWRNAKVEQTIVIPADIVWNVKILASTDIVCASSDGVIRIFTVDQNKFIDTETMEKFNEKVLKSIKKSTKQNENNNNILNTDELSYSKELNEPGEKDGDTVIVRRKNKVRVYRWSQENFQWQLVGDVVENKDKSSGKPIYNGIQYDYVFSVDVKKNAPLLKLPYNKGEDPYEAAHKFLNDNNLDIKLLDKVANFIITNLQINPILNTEAQYQDPFERGSRYISNLPPKIVNQTKSDAFHTSLTNAYIPQKSYVKLEQGNLDAIQEKIKEFSTKYQDELQSISSDKLEFIIKLISSDGSESIEEEMGDIESLLQWPDNFVFPVLDMARLAVLKKNFNEKFSTKKIFSLLKCHIRKDSIISNQMLTFRLLANLFSHESGENFCFQCKDVILNNILEFSTFKSKNNEVAVSTYILNLIITLNKMKDASGKEQILNVILRLLEILKESEAIFRILVGLGTLIIESSSSDERDKFIKFLKTSRPILTTLKLFIDDFEKSKVPNKLSSVSKQIIKLIR